jgi:hypothetical protein
MDIARPELKRQKRRRQILWASIAVVVLIGATVGISRLKPAAPTVESQHHLDRQREAGLHASPSARSGYPDPQS